MMLEKLREFLSGYFPAYVVDYGWIYLLLLGLLIVLATIKRTIAAGIISGVKSGLCLVFVQITAICSAAACAFITKSLLVPVAKNYATRFDVDPRLDSTHAIIQVFCSYIPLLILLAGGLVGFVFVYNKLAGTKNPATVKDIMWSLIWSVMAAATLLLLSVTIVYLWTLIQGLIVVIAIAIVGLLLLFRRRATPQ